MGNPDPDAGEFAAQMTQTSVDGGPWEAVAQLRGDHPNWVIIWSDRKQEFQARPLFHAPVDAVATGGTADELITAMDAMKKSARRSSRAR